jgi:hypothetical protein
MEIAAGKGAAIRGDKQIGMLKKGGFDRHQFYLYGPLRQKTGRALFPVLRQPGLRGRMPRARRGRNFFRPCPFHIFARAVPVKGGGFPFLKSNGGRGTGGQTIAESVAIIFPQQSGFAVHHADGAFMTGIYAQGAANALFFADMNNSAYHPISSLSVCPDFVHFIFYVGQISHISGILSRFPRPFPTARVFRGKKGPGDGLKRKRRPRDKGAPFEFKGKPFHGL